MSVAFCEHCKSGYVLPGEPTGTMQDGAYFASGADSTRAVVLLTDIFGLPLKNSKILADQFAEQVGCDVWVPDLFAGVPPIELSDMDQLPQKAGERMPFTVKLSLVFTILLRLPRLLRSRGSVVDARLKEFMAKLKETRKYAKIGAVGYCFGGSVAIRMGSTDMFDTVVVVHPGQTNIGEIKAIKVPSLWLCAEEDISFGPKLRNEAEAVFAERKDKPEFIDYEFKDYKGTVHGFAARPALSIPEIKAAFEAAFTDTVNWFKKTLFA